MRGPVPLFDGLLGLLDSRSFTTIWFWLMLATVWSMAGRNVLGVPIDVIRSAAKPEGPGDRPEALALLDWLSLMLPRWRVASQEGSWLTGIAAFALTVLAMLGFGYGLEMAQALFLLTAPLGIVALMNLRLARVLRVILSQAQAGQSAPNRAAADASRRMRRHRIAVTAISVLVVGVTAFWGTLWMLARPF